MLYIILNFSIFMRVHCVLVLIVKPVAEAADGLNHIPHHVLLPLGLNFLGLNLWLDSFDQVMILVPYVLVAPRLFAVDAAARVSLGTLVQTSNSFDKVFVSLSILSENWGGINEWRSTFVRLRQFEEQQQRQREGAGGRLADRNGAGSEADSEPGSHAALLRPEREAK